MITRSYDIIVAGFRPGGLLAGAILAKKGLRVLAINQDGSGPTTVGKYTFPSHRYPFIGFDDEELLGGAIGGLTIHPNERRLIAPSCPSFQVILPRQRIDVYPDDRFLLELEREMPKDLVILQGIYDRLRDAAGFFVQSWQQKRQQPPTPSLIQKMGLRSAGRREKVLFPSSVISIGQLLDELQASSEVRAFLMVQLSIFGYALEPECVPLPIAAHLLTSARGGLYGMPKSPEPLVALLAERLRTLHSDVMPQERLTGLGFNWSRLQEVSFSGYDQRFSCEYLIWNAPFGQLVDILPENLRGKGYSERHRPATFERYEIHLALDEFVVPVGMHEHVIIVGDLEAPFHSGNAVFMSLSPEGSEAFAPPGTRAVTVSTAIPTNEEHKTREARRAVATRMLGRVKSVIPFMEQYVKTLHVPLPTGQDEVGDPIYEASMLVSAYEGDMGPGPGLPHWNVFQAGREAYPLLGLEGEIAAGILAADAVLAYRKA